VVRAALESIAYQVKDALDLMVAEAGVPLRGIWGDGGASRNRFLMQFTADMIRYPLRVSRLAELSALGAVFMGLLGLGEIDSFEQIERMPLPVEEYTPQMAEAEMQHLYDGWKAAVRQVL
jgi:glycerol kinase